jgi:hypothetical protein
MLPLRPRPFLAWRQIKAAATEVAELAAREGRRVALAGGAALLCYRGHRLVEHVELLADGPLDVTNLRADVPVHVTVVGEPSGDGDGDDDDDDDDDDYMGRLRASALEEPADYEGVPVARAEVLAVLLLAGGDPRERADLVELLGSDEIDVPSAKAIAREHLGQYGAEQLHRFHVDAVARFGPRREASPAAFHRAMDSVVERERTKTSHRS